jgi:cell division cycle 20, cofactor of APC complex
LQVAVALANSVYLWNAQTGNVEELCSLPSESEYVSSLSWAADGHHLAIGTSDAKVRPRPVFEMRPQPAALSTNQRP